MKKNPIKKWMYDFILGICMLALVAVALIYSDILDSPRVTLFLARPDTYMALWLLLLALLSVLLITRSLKLRKTEEGQEPGMPIWGSMAVFTAAVLFLYLLLLKPIGFFLDSVLMLWALTLVYTFNIGAVKKDWRDKKLFVRELIKSGVFSVIASAATYYIFTNILTSKLPTFSLF